MTTQQHTPGPWRVLGLNGGYEPTIASAGDVFIACTQHPASEDEDLANAVLIAAAPDLLAVAQEAYRYIDTRVAANCENARLLGKLARYIREAGGETPR